MTRESLLELISDIPAMRRAAEASETTPEALAETVVLSLEEAGVSLS